MLVTFFGLKLHKCTDRGRRFRLTFLSILSETVFSYIAPVSNENENEWRTLCTDLSNHMTESGVTSCIFLSMCTSEYCWPVLTQRLGPCCCRCSTGRIAGSQSPCCCWFLKIWGNNLPYLLAYVNCLFTKQNGREITGKSIEDNDYFRHSLHVRFNCFEKLSFQISHKAAGFWSDLRFYSPSDNFSQFHGLQMRILDYIVSTQPRVDRVPGFLSSRPNGLPRSLTRKRELPPPSHPFGSKEGGERGRGELIRTKGQTLWYSSILGIGYSSTIHMLFVTDSQRNPFENFTLDRSWGDSFKVLSIFF